MTLQEILASLQGKTGKAIDTVGTWLGDPLPELNLSEKAEAAGAAAIPTEQRVTDVQNDPRFGTVLGTSTNQYYPNVSQVPDQPTYIGNTSNQSRLDELKAIEAAGNLNPAQKTELQQLQEPTQGSGGTNAFEALVQRARGAYEEAVNRARYGLDRARGVRDEGLGLLGKRRAEFKETYDTGNNDILTSYEGERGNLQASNTGAQQRAANALRAMGITGGSGAINYQGRIRQEQAKQQGNLSTEKTKNEKANLGQFNERNLWADTQEGEINRAYRDAEEAARATEAQAGLVLQGDVDDNNRNAENDCNYILANQQALAAAGQNVKGYVANPYAVDVNNYTGAIANNIPAVGTTGGTNTVNTGVSLEEMDPTLAVLLKRAGVAGAGLYA